MMLMRRIFLCFTCTCFNQSTVRVRTTFFSKCITSTCRRYCYLFKVCICMGSICNFFHTYCIYKVSRPHEFIIIILLITHELSIFLIICIIRIVIRFFICISIMLLVYHVGFTGNKRKICCNRYEHRSIIFNC